MVKKNITKNIILAITVLILMGLIIFFVGRSYGFFQYIKKGETTNIVSIKGIKIEVIEDDNALNLENAEPLYDKDGMELKAFSFSITNTSSKPLAYNIKVVNDQEKQNTCLINEGEEETTCPILTTDNIRYSYKLGNDDWNEPANLGNNSDIIHTYTINGKETLTYSIKIWIKSDATNEIMNHYFFGQLIIQGAEADHERIDYEELEAGLYDSNYKMLTNWDTLVNDYGLDVEKDYDLNEDMKIIGEEPNSIEDLDAIIANNINPTSIDYIITNNDELKDAKVLVIGDSVNKIGSASIITQSLEEVVIPSSVTEIGEGSFAFDKNIKNIVFKNNSNLTTIGGSAFVSTGIKALSLPSTVTEIGDMAFYPIDVVYYSGLAVNENNDNWGANSILAYEPYKENGLIYTEKDKTVLIGYEGTSDTIIIPSTVKIIANNAFEGKTNIKNVIFENIANIEEVGTYAFANTGIESIELPVTAVSNKKIGYDAFYNIPVLYTYEEKLENAEKYGALSVSNYTEGDFIYVAPSKSTLIKYTGSDKRVTVPDTVKIIAGDGVFIQNGSTKIVDIPSSVKKIFGVAFYYMSAINYTGVAEDTNNNNWGALSRNPYIDGDFVYTDSTKETLVAYIGDDITNVVVPDTVKTINTCAFVQIDLWNTGKRERFVKQVTIPSTVTTINNQAFEQVAVLNYTGVAEDTNNDNWGAQYRNPYIEGDFAYSDSTKTTVIKYIGSSQNATVPNGVTTIGEKAFYGMYMKAVTLPASIVTIGKGAFFNTDLESINLPEGLTTIEEISLKNTRIGSITLPSTLKTIGKQAFVSNYIEGNIPYLEIPEGVTEIGENAFYNIGYIIYNGAAEDTKNDNWGALARNPYIEENYIYTDSSKTTLAKYIGNSETLIIPDGITKIGRSALVGTNVKNVVIPEGVTEIGEDAFFATKLIGVSLPSTLKKINSEAFSETLVTTVTIPASVTTIGGRSFIYSKLETAIFEDPNGWWDYYTNKAITDLSDPIAAAKWLTRDKYNDISKRN